MDNIIVISQNVKLESLHLLREHINAGSESIVISTQFIFDNEASIIRDQLGTACTFMCFADFLNDSDEERCDKEAYNNKFTLWQYYDEIKVLKNRMLVDRVLEEFPCDNRLLVCDDLGIHASSWLKKGFIRVECEYYYKQEKKQANRIQWFIRGMWNHIWPYQIKNFYKRDINEAYKDGKKYLFFGSLNRIGYRLDLEFKKASKWENVKYILQYYNYKFFRTFLPNNTTRLSTLHECFSWQFPDHKNANVKFIQDGYLPPNYSSRYLMFYGKNIEYYTWDSIGKLTFEYHGLKNRIIPFRKKLYLPSPSYPTKLKKVLCVASGSGDWTAVKNRSDEDKMMVAFGKVAALFPEVEFIYRCHPVWVHPQHQGVNSIVRAAEYIDYLNLPNLKISANIPNAAKEGGGYILSYKRSSFEEDLAGVDIVFGEHSISMIDAAFKSILFCSVNVTGRRDFFKSITDLGFPHCESVEEITGLLNGIITPEFKQRYDSAVERYNNMTNEEEQ